MGRALCLEAARRGGQVIVSDVSRQGAEETADLVRAEGAQAWVTQTNVTQLEELEALRDFAVEKLGTIDVLANNAGVGVGGLVDEVSQDDWEWVINVNLWGVINGCRLFVPVMRKQGHGAILNVASAAGLISAPQLGPYNVSKAGVVALSETMHAELSVAGIAVTVLCPTFFKTNIAESARGVNMDSAMKMVSKQMERSSVQAPDVAKAAFDDLGRNRLYCVPMADGRAMWRLKRATPAGFARLGSRLFRKFQSREQS